MLKQIGEENEVLFCSMYVTYVLFVLFDVYYPISSFSESPCLSYVVMLFYLQRPKSQFKTFCKD